MADAIGTGLGAFAEIVKLIATKDDKARAEVMWAVDKAADILVLAEPEKITALATELLDYVYAEGKRRAKRFPDAD